VNATELANKLHEKFGELVSAPSEFRGEFSVKVTDAERIVEVCAFAKKELGFDYLVDVSSVDNYGEDPRWTVVYHLYGIASKQYIRLSVSVTEEKSELPTVTTVWRTADWHEREIYDMMGIRFRGHPDLRRILMASPAICRKWRSRSPLHWKADRSSLRPVARIPSNASRALRLLKADLHG
jgi:NADH-quinone oxidoreductase subunit C